MRKSQQLKSPSKLERREVKIVDGKPIYAWSRAGNDLIHLAKVKKARRKRWQMAKISRRRNQP